MSKIILFIFSFLFFNDTYAALYSETTSWDLPIKVKFNQLAETDFNSTATGIIRFSNSIDPVNTYYSEDNEISYSWTLTWIKFAYKILNTWFIPAWFQWLSWTARENYFIDNVCKNSSYDLNYSSYSGDKFHINYNVLEWTLSTKNKFLVLCVRDSTLKYWAYGMAYNTSKELSIITDALNSYSYLDLYGPVTHFELTFLSKSILPSWKIFKYYLDESWTTCSDNISDYIQVLNYTQISWPAWQKLTHLVSDGDKKVLVCFWVFKTLNNSIILKTQKILKFNIDNTSPSISITANNWTETTWYSSARNITIKCTDINITNCNAIYGWDTYNWVLSSGDYIISIPLNKNGNNSLSVVAHDNMWNSSSISKQYKLDTMAPSLQVYFEEIVTSQVIIQIKVKIVCVDNLSWCQSNTTAWWTNPSTDTYEKTYTSNQTQSITFTDNVWNTETQSIIIFNINKSLANWYGEAYSSTLYKELSIWPSLTSCWVPTTCDRNSLNTLCSEFQASINPITSNGYDVYTSAGQKYKANHRLATEYGPFPWGVIRCQYYDGVLPDFNIKNQILVASDENFVYKFDGLTEAWGSWLKEIVIKYTKENWSTSTITTIITNSTQENNLKNWTLWIDLGFNYKDISSFDASSKWYGKIDLEIVVKDSAWNISPLTKKNDSIYIVPWAVHIVNSFSLSQFWEDKSWILLADWDANYKYSIHLKDQFNNQIKNFTIPLSIPYIRTITSPAWIVFTNSTTYLWSINNPMYYKWPGSISWSNTSNSFTSINSSDFDNSFDFYAKSIVPTNEWLYLFSRWSVNLSQFIINDTKFPSVNFASNSTFKQKLKYWPAYEASVDSFTSTINDNTNYTLILKYIKHTTKSLTFNPDKIKFEFNFSNSGGLFKRFKIDSQEKYSNNGIFSFDISPDITWNKTYIINMDANGIWFWNSNIKTSIVYANTKINTDYPTSYQLTNYLIWSNQMLTRDIDIRWLIGTNNGSKWSNILGSSASKVVIDTNWFDKMFFKKEIKANIVKYVKAATNLVTSNTNYLLNLSTTTPSFVLQNGEKIYYYDFTNKSCTNTYNSSNQWCLVTLNWWSKVGVTDKINIIIKWWNLLLNSDMYYANTNAMIWYFVLRDERNTKNGWNVYITQEPTNLVWILYAEWSIMSVDSTTPSKVYINNNTNPDELNKQLLWNGSLFSANTVGWSLNYKNTTDKKLACPYGTDIYIEKTGDMNTWCSFDEANKYDFAALRRFASKTWPYTDGTCTWVWNYYSVDGNGDKVLNGFAGKKTCYSDTWDSDLMKVNNATSSFIVKYDSRILNNPLVITLIK